MTGHITSLEYRRAALQQASVTGLVVALHDTLIGNLRRAAAAMELGDIQNRCDELCHGFKVLQQLDAMLDMKNGGETAVTVRNFYQHVRGRMLSAQFTLSASRLMELVQSVLEVRQAWNQLDIAPLNGQSHGRNAAEAVVQLGYGKDREAEVASFTCVG